MSEPEILYDDGGLLAIHKPSGVLSHPNPGKSREPVAFPGSYDAETRTFDAPGGKIFLLHRLDLETSGVLLAARDETLALRMRGMFPAKKIRKYYEALILGAPREGRKGRWLDHLEKASGRRRATVEVVRNRKPNAELLFQVTRVFPSTRLTLVEIELITGLTHQIRVQAASRHRQILGDPLYGSFKANREMKRRFGLDRMFLHAARVEFRHPATGKTVIIKAPLPNELQEVLNKLR
jgi:RluA family pseudouridine synthase